MKRGDGQKMNLIFTVKPSNWKLPAMFRNSNSSGRHYLTFLIYDPPHNSGSSPQKGVSSITNRHPDCWQATTQAAAREFPVRYMRWGLGVRCSSWSQRPSASPEVQRVWGIQGMPLSNLHPAVKLGYLRSWSEQELDQMTYRGLPSHLNDSDLMSFAPFKQKFHLCKISWNKHLYTAVKPEKTQAYDVMPFLTLRWMIAINIIYIHMHTPLPPFLL